jgi:urease accessory protein
LSSVRKALFIAGIAAALPGVTFAHGGHTGSFAMAFAHPFGGLDHLLAMLIVGVWSARVAAASGRRALALPLAFVAAAAAGVLAGQAGLHWAITEQAVAASLIVIGLTLAFALRLPASVAAGICTLSGFVHGMAHGAELSGASLSAAAGLGAATALLHALGFGAMRIAATRSSLLSRLLGAGVGVTGIALVAQLA